jgi:hypothetical protein
MRGKNLKETLDNQGTEKFTHQRKGFSSKIVNFILNKMVVPKMSFVFHDEIPNEAAIFVGNHTRFRGPLAIQYRYPGKVRTWSDAKLIERKSCYDLFKNKVIKDIKGEKIFRVLLPASIPLISWYYRKKLNCIPVYRDMNVAKTFRVSSTTLMNDVNVAVYPEIIENRLNEVVCKFATGFVYIAYNFYKMTGKRIKFYPLYIAETIRETHFGKPIQYNPDLPIKEQADVIARYLEEQITNLARSLPQHKMVPIFGDYVAK